MNSLLKRLHVSRLASTFTVLATLSAGILIGSVAGHGVKGQEKVDSSDATPLKIPNPQVLSNTFAQIAREVGPAVVNINTETLPKSSALSRRRNPRLRQQPQAPDGDDQNGDGDSQDGQDNQGQGGMQDFFNRFFGGNNPDLNGPDEGGGVRESLGSGFIVDPKGYILTNNHVVDKADKIYVKLSTDSDSDGPGRVAHVVGVDKATDVAVIKIDTNSPLPTVKLGNSDAAQVGDWVIAIGSPFALSQTVTAGIVSAKNRSIEPGQQFQHFIQTDAAINPGNSGGPLVDMAGEVVGINTAIYTQSAGYQGIGFAMPANTVIGVYNQLISPEHKVIRGSIGIGFQGNLASAVGRVYGFKNGVLVGQVFPGQPAEKAGLKSGDVIVSLDGRPVKDGDDLVNDISSRKPGTTIKVGYLRSGKEESTVITIGDREKVLASQSGAPAEDNAAPEQENGAEARLGISIGNLPSGAASKAGIHGVIVQSTKPASFADEIGLAPNAIIVSVNRHPVSSKADFDAAVAGLKSGQDVAFEIVDPQHPKDGSQYRGGTLP